MSARQFLRSATGAAHARVDDLFSRFDLTDLRGYRRFITAQAAAFLPVESALNGAGVEQVVSDWSQRRRSALLRADLHALSVTVPEPFCPQPILDGKAPILGAAYVLEGSRLGAALLKRSVPDGFPSQFLDARQDAGSWRQFLKLLDQYLVRPIDLQDAAQAAEEVFVRFEQSARREMEVGAE